MTGASRAQHTADRTSTEPCESEIANRLMSPRDFLRRYIGSPDSVTKSRAAGWLGDRLHDPELWHLGRRSVAGGVGLGFFLAFIPLPIQMVIGTVAAFLLRVNLPITLTAIWLTNPVTMAPLYLFAFKVGSWITTPGHHVQTMHFEPTFEWMLATFEVIWWPLLAGCLICGLSAAAIGNLAVRWLWRLHLLHRLRQRRRERLKRLSE